MSGHRFIFGARDSGAGSGGGGSISVAVSDTSPNIGEPVTITATPSSGYTPTNYLFFARQGSTLIEIYSGPNASTTWQVSLFGSFEIIVQAAEATDKAWNDETVTSVAVFVTAGLELRGDPFLSNVVPPTYPDISGVVENRDGTMVNSPTFVAGTLSPNDGGYVALNGVNQRIASIGSTSSFNFVHQTCIFSAGVWVRFNSIAGSQAFFSSTSTSTERGFIMGWDWANSRFFCNVNVGGSAGSRLRPLATFSPVVGEWYYITLTSDGSNRIGQFYLNGNPITTSSASSNPNDPPATGAGNAARQLAIGVTPDGPTFFLNGRVGPWHIYDRALTHAEVLQNFNNDRHRYGI